MIDTKFKAIGGRVVVATDQRADLVDVRTDRKGEHFEVRLAKGSRAEVLDCQGADRHLLLLVRREDGMSRFLFGHDERHLFVAAIPETARVTTVAQAHEALKPVDVRSRQVLMRGKLLRKRRNAAFVRQGEWFFVATPDGFDPDPRLVLRHEPLARGAGSKPHMAEHCYREGVETVYVSRGRVVSEAEFHQIPVADRRREQWRVMVRNAAVYVRGRVRHADHKTINLSTWHRVFMNTESQAAAMRHVAFLD
jgi:hypothetical protein